MKLSIKIPLLTVAFAFVATILTFSLLARQHYFAVRNLIIEEIDLIIDDYQYDLQRTEKKLESQQWMEDTASLTFNKSMSQFADMKGLTYSLLRNRENRVIIFRLKQDLENLKNLKGNTTIPDAKVYENSARKTLWPQNVSAILLHKSGTIQTEIPGPFSLKKTMNRLSLLFRGDIHARIPVFQVVRPVYFGNRQSQPDLQICVGISVNHLWDYINRDLGAVAPWIAGLLALLALLAVLLTMDIIVSITKMTKAANELSAENYSYRIELKRKDELGQWASLFNDMASKIAAKISELNDKIAEISRLFKLATEDGLTKAFVHRYLMDLLENEIKRSKRNGTYVSFVMCDIDHFKKFNDTYGHQTGDYVLSKVSQVYMDNVRKNLDVVGRYGGEEFGIILPDTDKRGAILAAEKIRKAIESAQYSFKGNTFSVTISLGVSTILGGSTPKETLVKWADKALYNSKEKGRNRTSFYTEDKNVP